MKHQIKFKRNQRWKNKGTGKVFKITSRSTGNRHWLLDNGHHIHEGTLLKYYELFKGRIAE